jgi:hypothetical protein
VFHVASPSLVHVIRERVRFAELQIARSPATHDDPSVFPAFCDILKASLLPQKSSALEIVACLSGHDTRESLRLVKAVVLGSLGVRTRPGPTASFALQCLLAAGPTTEEGLSARLPIFNCFDADPAAPALHALRSRLLAYFSWAFDVPSQRAVLESTQAAVGSFTTWGYPALAVQAQLESLLDAGLLRPFTESERGLSRISFPLPPRLALTSSGYAHLGRLLSEPAYRLSMACFTRWYDSALCSTFIARAQAAGGDDGPTIADVEASTAGQIFEAYISRAVDREDAMLASAMIRVPWVAEVRARSARLVPGMHGHSERARPAAHLEVAPNSDQQLSLLRRPPRPEPLPTVRRECEYDGTVWIPRILWALEWARRNGQGRLTAAQVAHVLVEHGELTVPSTNVARAFRELRSRSTSKTSDLWRSSGKRYDITETGTKIITALVEAD